MEIHPILDELVGACGLEVPMELEGVELEAFLKDEVLPKASELSDSEWETLEDQTQLWAVAAFEKFNEDEPLPPLGDLRDLASAVPFSDLSTVTTDSGDDESGVEAAPADADTETDVVSQPEQPPKDYTLTKRRGPVGGKSHEDDHVITVLYTEGNPKRAGSISWCEWEELADGMTVKEFLAISTSFGKKPRRPELNGWHKQGLVRIAPVP